MRGIIVIIALALCGCATRDVDLTLTNPIPVVQSVSIDETDKSGAPVRTIQVGNVTSANNVVETLPKVDVDHSLTVKASGGMRDQFTVIDGSGPLSRAETLNPSAVLLTDQESVDQLVNAFTDLGPQTGFPPTDSGNAIATILGSLKCYRPANGSSTRAQVVFEIPPGTLSTKMTTAQISWPSGTDQKTVEVTSSASASVAISVPVYGSIKSQISTSALDKYTIQFLNFGTQGKPEDAGFILADALNSKLTPLERQAMLTLMDDSSIICTYFNQGYWIQNLNMTVEHTQQLAAGADLTAAGTVVTASGAYNTNSGTTENVALSDKVLNVWGQDFRVAIAPGTPAANVTLSLINPPIPPDPKVVGTAGASHPGQIAGTSTSGH